MNSVTITPFDVGNNIRIKWEQLPIITPARNNREVERYKVILIFRTGIEMFAPQIFLKGLLILYSGFNEKLLCNGV